MKTKRSKKRRARNNSRIVKVQRALAGAGMGCRLLIYDKSGEITLEGYATAQRIHELLGNDLKGYFKAHITPALELSVDERVEDQSW